MIFHLFAILVTYCLVLLKKIEIVGTFCYIATQHFFSVHKCHHIDQNTEVLILNYYVSFGMIPWLQFVHCAVYWCTIASMMENMAICIF